VTPSKRELDEWVLRHRHLDPLQLLAELTGTLIRLGRALPLSDAGIVQAVFEGLLATPRRPPRPRIVKS
jgi:hypothetical protein